MEILYLTVILFFALAGMLVAFLMKDKAARDLVNALVALVVGAAFLFLYGTGIDRAGFVFLVGVMCMFIGAYGLYINRLQARIRR
jgi:hypothetical protein